MVLTEHSMPIAPSTYYASLQQPVSDAQRREAYLVNALVDLYRENRCVYGIRKLWHAARGEGLDIGRDQVGRLMRIAGLQGVRRGARRTVTTTAEPTAPRHPDLVQRRWSAPTHPDAVWAADFTYIWTNGGFVYVSSVTRHLLGWKVATTERSTW